MAVLLVQRVAAAQGLDDLIADGAHALVARELLLGGMPLLEPMPLLDELDQLRLDLLTGTLPRARLERLAALSAAQRERIDDPRLAQIIEEIELRVAVELAKLDQ